MYFCIDSVLTIPDIWFCTVLPIYQLYLFSYLKTFLEKYVYNHWKANYLFLLAYTNFSFSKISVTFILAVLYAYTFVFIQCILKISILGIDLYLMLPHFIDFCHFASFVSNCQIFDYCFWKCELLIFFLSWF